MALVVFSAILVIFQLNSPCYHLMSYACRREYCCKIFFIRNRKLHNIMSSQFLFIFTLYLIKPQGYITTKAINCKVHDGE